jgi:hypothetical protein
MQDNTMKVVEPDVAIKAYKVLHGLIEATEQQQAFTQHIKRIFIPPAFRSQVAGYKAVPSNYVTDSIKYDVRPVSDENSRKVEVVVSGRDKAAGND